MNEVFQRGPSLLTRLVLVLLLSLITMVVDTKVEDVKTLRTYLTSLVSPIQYIADLPGEVLNWSATRFSSRQKLLDENQRLVRQIALLNGDVQKLASLERENEELRQLLGAPVRGESKKMIAELMAIDNNPYSHQILINKGTLDRVYLGQAVLDNTGIVGQISEVGTTNSRVLLISDASHAIPVRVSRNNVRLIAIGTGDLSSLRLQHVPHSADLRVGDLLTSSGLGNVFPEGYPVGVITSIISDESQPFAEVDVQPTAFLDRLKFLLLLWPEGEAPDTAFSTEELISEMDEFDATQ